jgi:hypothetical protein
LHSTDHKSPDRSAFSEQRRRKHGSEADEPLAGFAYRELGFRLGLEIVDVDRPAIDDRSATH